MAAALLVARNPAGDLVLLPARAIGSELGRQVLRGVLGSILGKRR